MAKNKGKCDDCPELPAWMTTFSDLMSLLLTFFILLLSFSSVEEDEFKKALGALQGALGVLHGDPILSSPIRLNVPIVHGDITEARPTMNDGKAEIEKQIAEAKQQQNVEVVQTNEGITIRIKDRALFDSGDADIKGGMLPLLNRIGGVLARLPNPIEIGGHTDNVPIHNERFPNNHWLSSARALQVLDVFANEVGISRERMSAIGYGEFHPLEGVPNDTPEHRTMNRRVEIKIRALPGSEGAADVARQALQEANLEVQE